MSDLRERVAQILDLMPRGTISRICENTPCTKPDVSNWLNDRRSISDAKLVCIIDWLLNEGLLTMEVRV